MSTARIDVQLKALAQSYIDAIKRTTPVIERLVHTVKHATNKPARCHRCHPFANPRPLTVRPVSRAATKRRRTK